MPTRTLIFDLDGTLLNSLQDIADAVNHSLSVNRYPEHDPDTIRKFVGGGIETLVARSLPEGNRDKATIARILHEVSTFYSAHWNRSTLPYPEIPRLLGKLHARKVKMAVLSNKPGDFSREMTRYFFPEIPFATIFGAGDGIPLKPDPGGIRAVIAEQSWTDTNTAMVGDSAADIRAAKAAGVTAVGVGWGFRSIDELDSAGADRLVHSPLEILDLLG